MFDAAIVDIVLGKNDRGGVDLVSSLRARSRTTEIVVITAFADLARVKEVLNLGASLSAGEAVPRARAAGRGRPAPVRA